MRLRQLMEERLEGTEKQEARGPGGKPVLSPPPLVPAPGTGAPCVRRPFAPIVVFPWGPAPCPTKHGDTFETAGLLGNAVECALPMKRGTVRVLMDRITFTSITRGTHYAKLRR